MAISDILTALDAQTQAEHKNPQADFLPEHTLPVVNQDTETQQARAVRIVDGDTVHVAPEQAVRTGGIGEKIADFWHSYDGAVAKEAGMEVDTPRETGRNYRQRGYNAMDKGLVGRDFAREVNDTMADRVALSDDESGSHGRGRATVLNRHGEDVGMDVLRLGLGAPTTDWGYSSEAQAAFDGGIARQALGIRRTATPELAGMEERIAEAKRRNPLQVPVPGDTAPPNERTQGAWGDSWDRGADGLQATVGAAAEWAGERVGSDSLRDYGKGVREQNTLEAAANPARVRDVQAIFDAKPGEKMDAAATYLIESLGENAPAILPDLLVSVFGASAGGIQAVAARRALTRSLTSRFGADAAERIMVHVPKSAGRKAAATGAGVGQFVSGTVQSTGSMQTRLKDAGVEDTGYAPLAGGLVGGALNVVSDQVPLNSFLDAAGLDEGVKRSVMKVATDTLKGTAAAAKHGFNVGLVTGAAQNATEQAIHNEVDEGKVGIDSMEMIDNALRSALGMATLNPASSLAGKGYHAAAGVLKDYARNLQDAGLAAAEKDMADEAVRNVGQGKMPEDSRYGRFKAATSGDPDLSPPPTAPDVGGKGIGQMMQEAIDEVTAKEQSAEAPVSETPSVVEPTTPPVVEPTPAPAVEPPPVVTKQGDDRRTASGFGTMHTIAPTDVPALEPTRYQEVASLLVGPDDELVPMKQARELVKSGQLTEDEVVQFLSEDLDPRVDTVESRLDNATVNQRMWEAFDRKAAELEQADRLAKAAGQRNGVDYKLREAVIAGRKAKLGKFRPAKEDPNSPRTDPVTKEDTRYRRTEFRDDASRIRAENEVLSKALKAFGEDINPFYQGSHQYNMAATYKRALEAHKAEVVPAPKDTSADPVADAPTTRVDPDEVIDIDNPNQVEDHLRSRGDQALSEIHTAIDLEGDIQKTRARFTTVARALARDGGVDKAKVLATMLAEETAKAKALPPEERAAAGQQIVDKADAYMKQTLKDAYSQIAREMHRTADAEAETTAQAVDRGYTDETGTSGAPDVHGTRSERELSQTPTKMAEDEAGHHYTRRTAYARRALAQVGKLAGVDLSPVLRMYEQELSPEERALGNKLRAGDEGQATVRAAVRDDADSLEATTAPATKGKGAAAPRDVHKLSRRTLAWIKRKMARGQYAEVYSRLHAAGLLPDEVDVNGKGLSNKTLFQRVMVPEGDKRRAGQSLEGVLVDSEGNTAPTRVDVPLLAESGMRELGYLTKEGDLDLGDTPLPQAIAEGVLAGLAQVMEPQRGMAYQMAPGMREPAANTVVWRSRTSPDVFMTWGDVRSRMADVWAKEDKKGVALTHRLDDLRAQKAALEADLTDRRFAQDPNDPNRQRVQAQIDALDTRIAEIEESASMYDRDADVAGLRWELDDRGEKRAVGFDDGPTSRTVVKPEHMTDDPTRTALDYREQLGGYGQGDFADNGVFESRERLPEDPVLTRNKDWKKHNPQLKPSPTRDVAAEKAAVDKAVSEAARGVEGPRQKAARKAAEADQQKAPDREPAAEVVESQPAAEAMAEDRTNAQSLADAAPEPVKQAMEAALNPETPPLSEADAQAQADLLVKRSQSITGSFRHHGVAKVFNKIGNLLVNTVNDRIAAISPYLAQLSKTFETEYRVRSQRLATHFNGFENEKRLQTGYENWLDGKKSLPQRLLSDAVRKIVAEVQKVDPTFRMDRPPVVFDMAEVQARLPALRELLHRAGIGDVETFVRSLHISKGTAGFRLFDGKEAPAQVMGVRQMMDGLDKAMAALRAEGFLKTDAPEILAGFTDSAAKYMEWARQFGAQVKGVDGTMTFDPSFRYRVVMDTLSGTDAGEMRSLFAATTGALGYNTPHWLRTVNSTMFAATAMRYLLFSGVASLPEMAAIGVRSRTGLKGAAKVVTSSLWRVAVSDRQALHQMAEGLGIVGSEVMRHSILNLYRADELTVGKVASKAAHYMFKYNGQYAVTELNSKLAMVHGMMFLAEHGQKAKDGDTKSARYLEELRISPDDAIAGAQDNNVNFQDAVHRFVLQSLTNPEAGVMPLWMSDPKFAVFASLKKFVYGLFDRVHRGVWREGKNGNVSGAVAMTAGFVAVAGALGALSETIRGMVKHPSFAPPAQEQEWEDKFWRVFNATGLQAHWQLAAGPRAAAEWGHSPASPYLAALNPTLDWVWSDVMDPARGTAQKVAQALPVSAQVPWAQSLVTDLLGGGQKQSVK